MSLKISRILHAGYIFEYDDVRIAFDPIFENPFSRNCFAYPNIEFDHEKIANLKLDAIFISHYHDDHCSLESLDHLNRDIPIYMYCVHKDFFILLRKLGFKNVHPLKLNETVSIGRIAITTYPALDVDVDSIFHIQADEINILNVVDSWIDWDTLKILSQTKWDMILWPFQTMREIAVLSPETAEPATRTLPPEWVEQIKILNPRFIVPSSCQFIQEEWSWHREAYFPITYRQFDKEISIVLPQTKVVRLNPSASVSLDKNFLETAPALGWITPLGVQEVDYEFNENLKIPPTSVIAKKFPALDSKKSQFVYDYCADNLLEKYRLMDPPGDEFFEKKRRWKLSLYDHLGQAKGFYYQLHGNEIELTNRTDDVDWFTEVPLTKLYAALELGESISSMYLRIQVKMSVEILNDPLIRCLFNGVIGSYQKAQLKKLR